MDRIFSLRDYPDYPFYTYTSKSAFLETKARHGISQILIDDLYLHALFIDREADTTLVHFGAALPSSGWETYPHFLGRKSGASYHVNHLLLSDPNYGLPGKLATGWFGGSDFQDLQTNLAEIIRHFSANGVEEQIILFGSSAGGFAALFYGAQLPNSVTISVNPRTDLRRMPSQYYRVAPYAFPNTPVDQLDSRIEVSIGDYFYRSVGNTVAYIQNVQDRPYFEGNLLPFLESNPSDPRVWVKFVDSGPNHVLPAGTIIPDVMGGLIDNAPHWETVLIAQQYENSPTVENAYVARDRLISQHQIS